MNRLIISCVFAAGLALLFFQAQAIPPSYSQDAEVEKDHYAGREFFARWDVIRPKATALSKKGKWKVVVGKSLWRTKTPNGWICSDGKDSLVVIVDPKHEWDDFLSTKKD